MADAASERTLDALLALEANDSRSSTAMALTAEAEPSVEARVDMFLRAVYGPEHSPSAGQRAAARARILDAMAVDVAAQLFAHEHRPQREQDIPVPVKKQAATTGAPAGAAPTASLHSRMTGMARSAAQAAARLWYPDHATRGLRFAAAAGVLIIVGMVWSAVWFHALSTLETVMAAWSDSAAQAGNTLTCASRTIGGFPFRVNVSCADPHATLLADRSTFTIKAKEFRAGAGLFRTNVVTAEVTGPVSIIGGVQPASYVANWSRARTDVRGGQSGLDQVSIVVEGFRFDRAADGGSAAIFNGNRATLDLRFDASASSGTEDIAIAIQVADGLVPSAPPFGSDPFDAEVTAVLRGIGAVRPQPWLARLKEWASLDGRLVVKQARIEQHGEVAVAQGTIGLDGGGRVAGRMRATTTAANFERLGRSFLGDNGRARVVQALARLGRRDSQTEEERRRLLAQAEQEARELRSIGVSPLPSANPGIGEVTMPLAFTNGVIFLGSVPIGEIPALY
jgi:hypothetical protein